MGYSLLFRAAVETAKISLPTVLEARRGVLEHAKCDERLRSWAERLLDQAEVELTVSGLQHLEKHPGPFVVVSNHQSYYDIPALYVGLPLSLRMAAKKELFRTPLWGPALRASGFVEIDRSSPKAAYKALRAAGVAMREHDLSLFIAPEGTRSDDGRLGAFKKGAFDVARVTKSPILPVALSGTRDIQPKGSYRIQRGAQVRLEILPPIQPRDFGPLERLADRVRTQIAEALGLPTDLPVKPSQTAPDAVPLAAQG